jgi:hypothetical protein
MPEHRQGSTPAATWTARSVSPTPASDGYAITLEQCATMPDAFMGGEREAEVVTLSGGDLALPGKELRDINKATRRFAKSVTRTLRARPRRGVSQQQPFDLLFRTHKTAQRSRGEFFRIIDEIWMASADSPHAAQGRPSLIAGKSKTRSSSTPAAQERAAQRKRARQAPSRRA